MGNSCSCQPKSSQQIRPSIPTSPHGNEKNGTKDKYGSMTATTPRILMKGQTEKIHEQSPHTAVTEPVESSDEVVMEQLSARQVDDGTVDARTSSGKSEDEVPQTDSTEQNGDLMKTVSCAGEAATQNLCVGKGRKRRRSTEDSGKKTTKKRKPTRQFFPGVSRSTDCNTNIDAQQYCCNNNNNNRLQSLKTFSIYHRQQQLIKCKTHHQPNRSSRASKGVVELNKKNNRKNSTRWNKRKQPCFSFCNKEKQEFLVAAYQCKNEEKKIKENLKISRAVVEVEAAKQTPMDFRIHPLVFELPTSIDEDFAPISPFNTPSHLNSSRCSGAENLQLQRTEEQEASIPFDATEFGIDLSQLPNRNSVSIDLKQSAFRSPPATERQVHHDQFSDQSRDLCNKPRPATARPNLQQYGDIKKKHSSKIRSTTILEKPNFYCSSTSVPSASSTLDSQTMKFCNESQTINDEYFSQQAVNG